MYHYKPRVPSIQVRDEGSIFNLSLQQFSPLVKHPLQTTTTRNMLQFLCSLATDTIQHSHLVQACPDKYPIQCAKICLCLMTMHHHFPQKCKRAQPGRCGPKRQALDLPKCNLASAIITNLHDHCGGG
jgi:hypothetical protein